MQLKKDMEDGEHGSCIGGHIKRDGSSENTYCFYQCIIFLEVFHYDALLDVIPKLTQRKIEIKNKPAQTTIAKDNVQI